MESYERIEEELHRSQSSKLVRFSLLARLAIVVAVIGLLADSLVHFTDGYFALFYKDLVNIGVILIGVIFFAFQVYKLETLVMIVVYSIYLNLFVSLPFRMVYFPDFAFEPYFLKMEVIFIILTYTIGVWVSPKHMQISIFLNGLFMLICFLFVNTDYSWAKYLFYFIAVTGAGLVAVRLQKEIRALRGSLIERSDLIKKQNQLLIENNKSKDDLFRIIGHDVRGPLGQLRMLIELLESDDSEEEFELTKANMLSALDKGNNLLKDLLDWAKNQGDEEIAELTQVNLSNVIDEQVNQLAVTIEKKNLSIKTLVHTSKKVYADERMLSTIFRNLLSNAVKFSNKNGEIEIGLESDKLYEKIYVKDNGVGMDKITLASLLKMRSVSSRKGTADEEGTGFGLLICNRLANKHGGELKIESELNVGTTVFLILPKE